MRKYCIAVIIIFCSSSAFSQLSSVDSAFTLQVKKYVSYYGMDQELVYVQFNKQFYFPGEHIWFKAYVLNRSTREPSLTTRNLYVELFDAQEHLIRRKILLVESGSAWDDFYLGENLPAGTYSFRAYTSWSKNFGADNYFVQALNVQGKKEGTRRNESSYDIKFFPEGGSLISGLPTTVAFKITDKNGYGISLQGMVTQNGNAIRMIRSNDMGMGAFSIVVKAGEENMANFTLPDGSLQKVALPSAATLGVQLAVDQHFDDSLVIDILTNEESLKSIALKKFHLLVHSQGKVSIVERPIFTRSRIVRYRIPKNILPPGVVHITLFNDQYAPVADRAIFMAGGDNMQSMQVTAVREKDSVIISVSTKDQKGKGIASDLSISVLPAGTAETGRNILSSALLESDFNEFIEYPAHYFNGGARDMEFLLLTQSGEQYHWNDIFNNAPVFKFPFEQGFSIRGTAPSVAGLSKIPGLFALSPDNGLQQAVSIDDSGKFELKNLVIYDSTTVYFNAVNESSKKHFKDLEVTELPAQFDPVFHGRPLLIRSGDSSVEIADMVINPGDNVMKEVRVTTQTRPKDRSSNDPFSTKMDKVIVIDKKNVSRYRDMIDLLRREFNLNISYDNFNHLVIDMRTGPISFLIQPPPVLVVDGMISNLDDLQFFSMAQIESVAVNKIGNAQLGSRGAGGSIILKTRETLDDINDERSASSVVKQMLVQGFSRPSSYFTTKYAVDMNDARFIRYGAIYWKPDVFTDENGMTQFKFFWPAGSPEIELKAEGISRDGKLLYFVKRLKL
jgi:hypothetical protein